MEFLEKIGDFFVSLLAAVERFITGLFGASNERMIRRMGFDRSKSGETRIVPGTMLDQINQFEPQMQTLSDDELKQTATKMRARLASGETLEQILPETFAAARESGRRFLKMRHYDVQMIGGAVLHQGMIAEMVTGEGKTLVATLAATLNAMSGKVHVVTVNDYLARRDMEWMAPLYMGLGLTVGAIQANMSAEDKWDAYGCDITYGTNNEFGFDYLRDNMKAARKGDPKYPSELQQVQGPLNFAIVDEIDNILIDEARTPLIISGPAMDDVEKYRKANRVAGMLKKDVDFEVKEKEHTCHLTEEGVRRAEELAGVDSFYTTGNMEWPHLIDNALKAHHLYKRDVQYVVMPDRKDGDMSIVIVDEFTGRLMEGRQWSDGLHQAVEAKENIRVREENQTLATITLQNYFKLYKKLGGMTGTAMTEANEFWKIYKLDVVAIPTNRGLQRINHPDVIFRSEREKYDALVKEIAEVHKEGRPLLIGTTSIEKSEMISAKLGRMGVKHAVLNAKFHEKEAEIIAQAGRLGAVTIATNMAGRGTDIILGGNPDAAAWEQLKHKYESRIDIPKPEWDALTKQIAEQEGMTTEGRKVAELGGLHVIGTERHEARRIDLQLRGRSGRQGDPGSSRFFLSLEDDLMRIFAGEWVKNMLTSLGMQEGEAIESRMVSRRVEGAQKKVEERHFEQRKHLLDYDEVMDTQRKRVYTFRQEILDGANCRDIILKMIRDQLTEAVPDILSPKYGRETVVQWSAQSMGIEVEAKDLPDDSAAGVIEFLKGEAISQAEDLIQEKIDEDLPAEVEDEREWNWVAISKWANARWGLNTNDSQLKKVGRDGLHAHFLERARDAIENRADFTPVEQFLSPEYGRQSLCTWLDNQYGVKMTADQFVDVSNDEAISRIWQEVEKMYREREIHFPVAVGMSRFLSDGEGGGERYDREGLVKWANNRFQTELNIDSLRGRERQEVVQLLTECSQKYYAGESQVVAQAVPRVDAYLEKAYGERNGHDPRSMPVQHPEPLREMAQWAEQELKVTLEADELATLPLEVTRQRVTQEIDSKLRPELGRAERELLLEIVDSSWKDHLYYMDHLRQGIGLVGYAQKDPKVEYRREGMKAFDQMWKRIAGQVTHAVFRLEETSSGFVGSLWRITDMRHDSPPEDLPDMPSSDPNAPPGDYSGGAAQGEQRAIEPIRNRGEKVGRNDPCPCGSGKKYKNCHMKK